MSSTNRGYERHKTDYYVTPKQPIKDFLDNFLKDYPINPEIILDPCAGGDEKNDMSYPEVLKEYFYSSVIKTIDVREDSLAEVKDNYLSLKLDYKPNMIISNPPFYLAKEFISKALQDVAEGGVVIMLLRLNFFGSNDRFEFFKNYMPIASYVHHRRFSFTEDKKTDSIEYMHAVWQKGNYPSYSKLRVI